MQVRPQPHSSMTTTSRRVEFPLILHDADQLVLHVADHLVLRDADEKILQELEALGYSKVLVTQGLLMGDTDMITACYHLALEAKVARLEAQAITSFALKRKPSISGGN